MRCRLTELFGRGCRSGLPPMNSLPRLMQRQFDLHGSAPDAALSRQAIEASRFDCVPIPNCKGPSISRRFVQSCANFSGNFSKRNPACRLPQAIELPISAKWFILLAGGPGRLRNAL
jgi:hypothetical protein